MGMKYALKDEGGTIWMTVELKEALLQEGETITFSSCLTDKEMKYIVSIIEEGGVND